MARKFPYLDGYQWTCILYVAVAVFCWQLKYFKHIDNNYLIFRQSYYHAKAHLNLYLQYPAEYDDVYLYGPLFTFFVAPFAVLPEGLGFFFWEVFNATSLLLAVHLLPFNKKIKTAILLLCVVEFANSLHYMQFNPVIAALVILSFIMVKKEKDHWATLLTIFGAFMKVYPIAGLAFFVFSKHKGKFMGWSLFWIVVCFFLPALISGSGFLLQSYHDWFYALDAKNLLNEQLNSGQDWCIMGVARRLTQNAALPNWPFLLGGGVVFGLTLMRFEQYRSLKFQLQVMCSVLLMVVIFSTGAEHPTFIIATAGAVIYIMMQPRPFNSLNIVFLIMLIVITGLGPSDVFPLFMRDWMQNLAMKAWPCISIWCKITYELLFKDFNAEQKLSGEDTSGYIAL